MSSAKAPREPDWTQPVAVVVLARFLDWKVVRFHGTARRDALGLVDAPAPSRGGFYTWVTGASAKRLADGAKALIEALHPN